MPSRLAALAGALAVVLALGAGWWALRGSPEVPAATTEPLALVTPRRVARADGGLLIADPDAQRVFRLQAQTLTVLAGNGEACAAHCCDEAAPGAPLAYPSDVVMLPTGGALVANTRAACVVHLAPDGRRSGWLGAGRRGRPLQGPTSRRQVDLAEPEALLVRRDGSVLVADAALCQVLAVAAGDSQGGVSLFAGSGRCGYGGDQGPAATAELRAPSGLLEALDGSVLIADTDNSRIRRVDPTGRISTLAGSGVRGTSPLPAQATAAALNEPEGLLWHGGGLVIVDTDNSRLLALRDGQLRLLAPAHPGDALRYPKGGVVQADGGLLIADTDNARLVRLAEGGGHVESVWPPDAAPRFEAQDHALDAVERERRLETLKATPVAGRAEAFRTLTDDLDLDDADRSLRWETLGPSPLEAFEALLKRAQRHQP